VVVASEKSRRGVEGVGVATVIGVRDPKSSNTLFRIDDDDDAAAAATDKDLLDSIRDCKQ